jgi:hypothetical protein
MKRIVLTLALASVSGAAHAECPPGWFLGGLFGQMSFGDYELESDAENLDDTDTGFSAFGGYLWRVVGVSIGYTDFGQLDADAGRTYEIPETRASVRPKAFPLGFTDTIESKGFDLKVHGVWRVSDRVALIGHVGLLRWNQRVRFKSGEFSSDLEANGTSPEFGGSVAVSLGASKSWAVMGSLVRHSDVGDFDQTGHENDIDSLMVGAIYRFGQ